MKFKPELIDKTTHIFRPNLETEKIHIDVLLYIKKHPFITLMYSIYDKTRIFLLPSCFYCIEESFCCVPFTWVPDATVLHYASS